MNLKSLAEQYRRELLDNIIPFWERYSIDRENGGYFTCLDRLGKIYDSDKFTWLQARQVWVFSYLYNNVEKKENWLGIAGSGARFLEKFGRDEDGKWYFSLTREGKPLVAPCNIFSDCFAAMAFAQMAKATGEAKYTDIALASFNSILGRAGNPKGIYNKTLNEARNLRSFSLPMILCNLSLEMEHLLDPEYVGEITDKCIEDVMEVFHDPQTGLTLENVNDDGSFSDSFDGRLINPGHGIEAMWFVMDLAARNGDRKLAEKAVERALRLLEYGWDQKYGGIFYFLDIKGYPPQQLEWDQKLWWVHVEALVTLIKGYMHTGNTECLNWFEKVHDYTWSHFPDPEYGEWFGYLNRRGEVLLPLKGGKWKGCFHIPRGLYQVWRTLGA
ncbi:MAG: AGE family epimerase/isomerase [Bacteroidales bacterium]|nr:AGE family epimerase/isomerase [Bacteroidales bacterium]